MTHSAMLPVASHERNSIPPGLWWRRITVAMATEICEQGIGGAFAQVSPAQMTISNNCRAQHAPCPVEIQGDRRRALL